MHFREAIPEDIPQLQLIRNSVTENVLSDPALVKKEDYEAYLFRRGKGWVCEIDKQVVRFSIVSLQDKNVWALFLLPAFERKGIGQHLHDLMLDWYFSNSAETIWLSTDPGTRAASFYCKKGWKENGFHHNEIRFEMDQDSWNSVKKSS
jgi:GNAT superfamily N-acetyltransferase